MPAIKLRILVAEDHADTLELFVLILEQGQYEVVTASSVRETLDLAKSQTFDIFVLDSRLTDGSGIDLCRSIRKFDAATPILFCSAQAFEKDRLEALSAGAQGYMVKPVNFSGLCEKVAELIASSHTARAPLVHQRAAGKDSGDLTSAPSVGV